MNKAKMIKRLERCFELAPCDDSYLRILVQDELNWLKTGKERKQLADEEYKRRFGK